MQKKINGAGISIMFPIQTIFSGAFFDIYGIINAIEPKVIVTAFHLGICMFLNAIKYSKVLFDFRLIFQKNNNKEYLSAFLR
jgi:hypothetical protein